MNRLPPAHMASLIMVTWFFASATGNFVSGLIAAATGAEGLEGETAGKETVLSVYSTVGWTAVAVGVGVMLISPLVLRLMHLATLKDDEPATRLRGVSRWPSSCLCQAVPAATGLPPPLLPVPSHKSGGRNLATRFP